MESTNITFVGAFVAGLLSFLSPCVLPLIPSFITYITGLSFADIQSEHPTHKVRQQTIVHSLLFIAGFTFVFVLLGASATFIGGFLHEHMNVIRKVGGALIVIFGIHVSGLVPIHLLLGEKRLQVHRKPAGYLGSFLVGLAFAAGWTPCIGPILASILMVAATEETVTKGILLLFTYSMGLAIPFFLSSLAMHQFLTFFNRFKKHIRILEIVTGLFLVVVGVMIFTNYLSVLSRYTMKWFGGM
ncbi:cytochrome c biogenesis protein CcdA [Geobacter sulfurreducens]|jgi:cytochrome c-type biogenesis protein|uniref:Cytochrome c biogenesis protein CcdA n=1 Tax=Geobacter sulfurreducens (strain ATCC 51573 / DSM 12127 / PCA) TaxID=243231 RepID=Q74DJ4_GEOSL|nr:cytochrome c biogenesis protein CcdA [Geobacter sulfurreducens]AAR34698.1 cytochrome c biogenesis protein CcdA [Geobacter sulfurreducens PCA]ADI84157.1 cytochrome c biogenesis protein CcdA [Geobacter sulfurreducens KN400]AJY71029.1 cytochrome C biogenesis protein [Geobacter sulfurreducens]QVW36531.1 cytochrome c biogenesis protein CcdA [Geobacter sulfurreducens]UAC05348.1 cytochrome c biogenesis protein CcdA [Geobacter sulfurreducens]